jgi:hypothetical protein
VAAIRRFDPGWHQGDESRPDLFGLLSRAGSRAIEAARDARTASRTLSLDVECDAFSVSFAPDGGRLAVLTTWGTYDPTWVYDFALPSGTLVASFRHDDEGPRHGMIGVLHFGDAFLTAKVSSHDKYRIDRYLKGSGRKICQGTGLCGGPVRHPLGFVVCDQDPAPGDLDRRLRFFDASGALVKEVALGRDLGLPRGPEAPELLAVDTGSGRLAVCGDRVWILAPDATRVLASSPPDGLSGAMWAPGFYDPDNLITYKDHVIRRWQVTGDRLAARATERIARGRYPPVISTWGTSPSHARMKRGCSTRRPSPAASRDPNSRVRSTA